MSQSTKKSFMQGAIVLITANIVVKMIGALYTIPLTNLIGADGIGYYNIAYELYSFLFILSTAGLPVAISKMVSESYALGEYSNVKRIFRCSVSLFSIVGLLFSLFMFFGAKVFASAVNNDLSYITIMVVAPSVFFIAIMSAFRGFFQGVSNMMPTAISQVLEAILKLGAGFAIALYLIQQGAPIHVVAAGAIGGVTLGTIVGSVALSIIYITSPMVRGLSRLEDRSHKKKSNGSILKLLIKYAVPITIGASVLSLTNILDLFVVMNRLGDIGFTQIQANEINGAYGMARKLFNLVPSIIAALGISVLPILSANFAIKNRNMVKKTIESALRICATFAIPSGIGLSALAYPILTLLYFREPEGVAIATPLLTILGFAVVFVCMATLTNAMLQSVGLVNVPVFTMLIGGIIKLIVNYTLIGFIGIQGAPLGTILCYGTITVLNLIILQKNVMIISNFSSVFLKPAISAAAMAVSAIVTYNFCIARLGNSLSTLCAILVASVIYFVLLIALKGLIREDVEMLPKGEKIAGCLSKKGLI